MARIEMSDDSFIKFQDEFYDLLEKYGVSEVDSEHPRFDRILELRNSVAEFIEEEKWSNTWNNEGVQDE